MLFANKESKIKSAQDRTIVLKLEDHPAVCDFYAINGLRCKFVYEALSLCTGMCI